MFTFLPPLLLTHSLIELTLKVMYCTDVRNMTLNLLFPKALCLRVYEICCLHMNLWLDKCTSHTVTLKCISREGCGTNSSSSLYLSVLSWLASKENTSFMVVYGIVIFRSPPPWELSSFWEDRGNEIKMICNRTQLHIQDSLNKWVSVLKEQKNKGRGMLSSQIKSHMRDSL